MGKTFKRRKDDWYDEDNSFARTEKFRKRRYKKFEKIQDHNEVLTPKINEDLPEED